MVIELYSAKASIFNKAMENTYNYTKELYNLININIQCIKYLWIVRKETNNDSVNESETQRTIYSRIILLF